MASDKKPAQAGGHHHLSFAENLVAGGLAGVGTYYVDIDVHLLKPLFEHLKAV